MADGGNGENREGPPGEEIQKRGGAGQMRSVEERRGEQNREGKGREPCCRGVPYELRGPPPSTHGLGFLRQSLPRRPMRFGRDPTTDPFGGCFWAEFRELPPRFPGGIPAVCRLPQTTRKRTRGRTSGSSMRESGPLCDCAVCFFQLCSESSQSRAFSAPHFAKATSWLGSCTCMGTGEGRYGGAGGRGGGSMWSTIKKANPQLARASFWPLQEEA